MRKKIYVLFILWLIFLFLYGCGKKEPEVIVPSQESSQKKAFPQEEEKIESVEKEPQDLVSFSQKRNPFLTPREEKFFREEKREEINYLTLSGIFYSPEGSYAIINGRIVKKKDIIDNKEVVKIGKQEVFLKDSQGKEYVVKLKKIVNE